MHRSIFWGIALAWLAAPGWSAPTYCEGTQVNVITSDDGFQELTCEAVNRANELFAQCGIPPVNSQLKIDIVSRMKDKCVALYHCGEGRIEILEPPLMQSRRETSSAFSFLDLEAYYQSVIVHELTHVAFDDVPCPFEICLASNEYVAYAMQIMSMPPEAQQEFISHSDLNRRVTRDELNAIILLMAPNRFAQKVWAHLSQQEDPCAFIRQIMNGTVQLDQEQF